MKKTLTGLIYIYFMVNTNRYKLLISSLCLIFLFFSLFSSAASNFLTRPISDTTNPTSKPYKISAAEFQSRYGTDDSSRALIDVFFKNRHSAHHTIMGALWFFLGGAALIGIVFAVSSNPNPLAFAYFAGAIAVTAVAISLAFLIVGGLKNIRYSKKKLYDLLEKYHAGLPLPSSITSNKLFKFYLGKK